MRFLSGKELLPEIRTIITGGDALKLAVAYWGRGAVDRLGIGQGVDVKIICDLRSGACDPDELRKLSEWSGKVRMRDGWHAKVYWTPNAGVVCSANASANGLGEEGDEVNDVLEAGILITDAAVLRGIEDWFDRNWSDSLPVKERDLEEARRRRTERRRRRPIRGLKAPSLLELLKQDSSWFTERGMRLVFYHGQDVSDEAKAVFDKDAAELYDEAERNQTPYYEVTTAWLVSPGEIILDFTRGARGAVYFNGIWKVLDDAEPFRDIPEGGKIVLLRKTETPFGLSFPQNEQEEVISMLKDYYREQHPKEDEHGNLLDVPLDQLFEAIGRQ